MLGQSMAMYNAMRKTTESEREAQDQIKEQANKYARNEGPKVENGEDVSDESYLLEPCQV